MADTAVIFIYGTLRRGCRAHFRMEKSRYAGEACVNGKLVYVDRYPGLILAEEGVVKGELYEVSRDLLSRLDEYEGCFCEPPDYIRQTCLARLSDNTCIRVETYVFQLESSETFEITGGDWLSYMQEYPELNTFQ